MAAVRQVVEFDRDEVVRILGDRGKEIITEAGGKQVQGKVEVTFQNGADNSFQGARVSFERAGK